MFKSIGITNFQSHKETNLTLDNGVNVISGTSDSGKTAILRSLNWLFNNRPFGDAFKNWNVPLKEPVSVVLELEDGNSIVIERQNGKNTYSIFNKDGEVTTFSAIKTDVPKEVTELLNLAEYNYQSQHQPYFLLQDTPGEIAKKLNDLVGLSIIDTLFSNIASKIRQTSIKVSMLVSKRDNTVQELKKYTKLDEIESIVKSLEKLYGETAGIASSLNQIASKLTALEKIKTEREKLIPLIKLEKKVDDLFALGSSYSADLIHMNRLSQLVASIKKVKEQIPAEKEWANLEPFYNEITGKIKEYGDLSIRTTSLSRLLFNINNVVDSIDTQKKTKKDLSINYIDLIKESNTCPTCGSRINAACLAAIERSFS